MLDERSSVFRFVFFGGGSGGNQTEASGPEASASMRAAITKSNSCSPPIFRVVNDTSQKPQPDQLRMVPAFFRQSTHGVGEGQRRAIVGEAEATCNGTGLVTELPIGNFHKIGCAFARCEWAHTGPTGRARTLRERNHFTALDSRDLDLVI